MENLKEKRQGKIIGFLCIVCLILAFSSLYFAFSDNASRKRERLVNEKAVTDLMNRLNDLGLSEEQKTAN